MTEGQLEQEVLGWLADVGRTHLYGPDTILFVNGLPLVLLELNPRRRERRHLGGL